MFKPTPAEWGLIKEVAFRGHYPNDTLKSVAGVSLEGRLSVNVNEERPRHINMLIVSDEQGHCSDCDLFDKGTIFTDEFRAGAELTEVGDGLFDFYIYNRYDPDYGDLLGNVLVRVTAGKMAMIWIEGGLSWSWTPETGIVPQLRGRTS